MDAATVEAFVSTEAVAELLDKPASWIHNCAESHGMPRYKIGNHYRYLLSEVAEWAKTQAAK